MKKETAEAYSEIYAEYYDVLTQHKDYFLEARKLNELIESLEFDEDCSIIDIGCGTGGHAIPLSLLRKNPISAIDISEPMVSQARVKESRVRFLSGDLSGLASGAYKFAFSLFNVVNCITRSSELRDFFLKVNEKLEMGGYYFFEFWNRTAVLDEPPVSVTRVFDLGKEKKITRLAEPDLSGLAEGNLNLNYQIEIMNSNGHQSEFKSLHKLKLHSLEDFQRLLSNSGFEIKMHRGALPQLSENRDKERMLSILAKKMFDLQ